MRNLTWIMAPALAFIAAGCVEPRITNTGRSAVEQNLLSHAVERSVDNMSFSAFAGKNAILDYSKLAPQADKEYVCGVLETHLAASGIKVVEKPEEAQIRIRFFCGVLATDNTDMNIGTPALPIPIPYCNLNIAIPEIYLFKRRSRTASCRATAVIYDVKTGEMLAAYRGVQSRTFYNLWVALMIFPFTTRDVEVADTGTTKVDFWD